MSCGAVLWPESGDLAVASHNHIMCDGVPVNVPAFGEGTRLISIVVDITWLNCDVT